MSAYTAACVLFRRQTKKQHRRNLKNRLRFRCMFHVCLSPLSSVGVFFRVLETVWTSWLGRVLVLVKWSTRMFAACGAIPANAGDPAAKEFFSHIGRPLGERMRGLRPCHRSDRGKINSMAKTLRPLNDESPTTKGTIAEEWIKKDAMSIKRHTARQSSPALVRGSNLGNTS